MYGQAILDLAENHSDIMVLSADLGNSSGLDRFSKSFPNQFINVGIAEQNLVGVAAGLAKEGYTVFASSFAPTTNFLVSLYYCTNTLRMFHTSPVYRSIIEILLKSQNPLEKVPPNEPSFLALNVHL